MSHSNPIHGLVIGLDLGGTKLSGGLFRILDKNNLELAAAQREIRYKKEIPNFASLSSKDKSSAIENLIVGAIEKLKANTEKSALRGAGIVSAGFIEKGLIVDSSNIGMKNYPLEQNLSRHTGLVVKLTRDNWAPVFAAGIKNPSILFSVGTGFGGVSCQADKSIPLKSFTVTHWPIWIPRVYMNDDPGYAMGFSPALIKELLEFGLSTFPNVKPALGSARMTDRIMALAADNHKATPSAIELGIAKLLAWKSVIPFKSGEVFPDFFGGAAFAGIVHQELFFNKPLPPEELDRMAAGDEIAAAAFFIHGVFIGEIIAAMQKERTDNGLVFALDLFGTGSGFNEVNHQFVSKGIIGRMEFHRGRCPCLPVPAQVNLLQSPNPDITLAALGAALGFLQH